MKPQHRAQLASEIFAAVIIACLIAVVLYGMSLLNSPAVYRPSVRSVEPTRGTNKELQSPTLLGSDWIDHEDTERGVVGSSQRSSKWPTVRARFIATRGNDRCAVCGSVDDLNVHHVVPFHDDPSLELEPTNLITLCREHHFHVGHDPDCDGPERANWSKSNPNVRRDAERLRKKLNPQHQY